MTTQPAVTKAERAMQLSAWNDAVAAFRYFLRHGASEIASERRNAHRMERITGSVVNQYGLASPLMVAWGER